MTSTEIIIFSAIGVVIWFVCEWLLTKLPPSCTCDEANQGRECPNCTPPRVPRR